MQAPRARGRVCQKLFQVWGLISGGEMIILWQSLEVKLTVCGLRLHLLLFFCKGKLLACVFLLGFFLFVFWGECAPLRRLNGWVVLPSAALRLSPWHSVVERLTEEKQNSQTSATATFATPVFFFPSVWFLVRATFENFKLATHWTIIRSQSILKTCETTDRRTVSADFFFFLTL